MKCICLLALIDGCSSTEKPLVLICPFVGDLSSSSRWPIHFDCGTFGKFNEICFRRSFIERCARVLGRKLTKCRPQVDEMSSQCEICSHLSLNFNETANTWQRCNSVPPSSKFSFKSKNSTNCVLHKFDDISSRKHSDPWSSG